jgi:hypothetical protein
MDFTSEPDIDPAQRIRAKVKTQDERRRKTSARSFKIRVDGSLAGVLAGPSAVVEVPLPSHANLIQVYGNSNSNEEVLLATHILTHNEHGGLTPSAGSVTLGLRHRFSFTVPIHDDRSFDNTTAVCCVRHSSVMLILPSLSIHAPAYAALFAIFVCGWVTSLVWRPGLNGKTQTLETELGHARTERNEALRQLELIQGGIPPVELRRLQAGGDRGSRSPEKDRLSGIQELVVPNTPRIMTLNLPLPTTDAVSFRATLQTFESSRDLLAQTGLTAMRINGHLVVQWKVSSTVFGTSGGYVVQLFNESENAAEPRVIARFGLWVGKN